LGFGTHNCLYGGRQDTISNWALANDTVPFLPKCQLILSKKAQDFHRFDPIGFGSYYLEFAGGDDSFFKTRPIYNLAPSTGFASLEDELIAIDKAFDESIPKQLRKNPAFIFGSYKHGCLNKPLFKQLLECQKRIKNLLNHPNFLEQVLEILGEEKPSIKCSKANLANPHIYTDFTISEWLDILNAAADQFKDEEQKQTFLKIYSAPTEEAKNPPEFVGVSKATFLGLKKALANLTEANNHFNKLSKDTSLKPIVSDHLFFKTTKEGTGKKLEGAKQARVGYIIEDLQGTILFANYDTRINLSQTFVGFAHGIQGMKVGEKRTIYIHPAYGYGALTTLPPCTGLILKVDLKDFEDEPNALPSLKPLEMDWLQEATYLKEIESSIKQKPKYLGFLYRSLLDEIGVDQSKIIPKLLSSNANIK